MALLGDSRKSAFWRILAFTGVVLVVAVSVLLGGMAVAVRGAKPRLQYYDGIGFSVAWSPDGRQLASATRNGTVKLWEAETGELRQTLTAHSNAVRSVAWSPDGRQLASGSLDNTVKVWEAETGLLRRTLSGHADSVHSVAWSPDGRQLASASSDNTVKVWEAKTGLLRRTLPGHAKSVFSVAWSPDGRQLASGSSDNTVKVWEAETGLLRRTLSGHPNSVSSVAWSPDGRQLVSGSEDNTVKVWEAETGLLRRTLSGHANSVYSVAWSPDGRQLASGSSDNTVKVWEAETGLLRHTLSGHANYVWSVAWSPDGRQLASGSEDNTVKVWEAETGLLRRTLSGHSYSVYSVAWSPDGRQLATASADNTVKVWEAETGLPWRTLSGHANYVYSVAWSPDGRQLATASADNTVKVWEAKTGLLRRTLPGHAKSVFSVAWSPDGRQLASGSSDNTVKVWEAETGLLRRTLSGHPNSVSSVAWSPDGRQLASGSEDNTVKVWEAETGLSRRTLSGHANSVYSVAWSPDGRQLASASSDNTVKVWEAETGLLRRTLSGHANYVWSVAWSPDGRQLASGSEDNTVKVWEAETGLLRRTLSGHSYSVSSVAWSPDGRQLATASVDTTFGLWRSDWPGILLTVNMTDPAKRLRWSSTNGSYECSGDEDDHGQVNFGPDWISRYRLSYERASSRVSDVSKAFDRPSAWHPGVLTESAAYVRRHASIIGILALVYLAGAGGMLLVATHPLTAAQLSGRFFPSAGFPAPKSLSANLLALEGAEPAYAATWPPPQDLRDTIARHRKGVNSRFRVYLVGDDIEPGAVQSLGQELNCLVIPLAASGLERALADGKAKEILREMEEPFVTRTDPYDEAKAITDPTWFHGRTALLEELPAVLRQGQHAGLFGLRKVGKTSVLSQLRLRMIDVPLVLLDCQAYEPVAADLLREILIRLRGETARLLGKPASPTPPGESLKQLRDQLADLHDQWKQKSNERFVLILDEVDKWFPDRRDAKSEPALLEFVKLFRILRALAQERGMLSILVAAYRPDVNRQNLLREATGENPMYLSFQEKFVGFLSEEETRKMIREIGAWKEILWTDDALTAVWEACGGHPMLSRILASDACAQGSRKQVGQEDVARVTEAVRSNFRKHRIGVYFEGAIWDTLRDEEREALLWAGSGKGAPRAEWEEALVSLEHFGLIRPDAGGMAVNGGLLRDWLAKKRQSS